MLPIDYRETTMPEIARTPAAPYYAVIFTSLRTEREEDYQATAARMEQLAAGQPGFLGIETPTRSGEPRNRITSRTAIRCCFKMDTRSTGSR